ncbi:MAG: hypothetical protein ACR2QC_09095 [Gammaproteobacteria bacterium]
MRFRLSPEWRILIRRLKVPPFRRKPESPRRRREISRRPPFFIPPSSHSCESRNLRRREAAGNCTFVRLRRQFAPSAQRFLLSQEWDEGAGWNSG